MSLLRSSAPGASAPLPPSSPDERWERTKAVFLPALDLEGAERDAFVRQACGADAALLAEVQSLLASDAAAAEFCEDPAVTLLAERPDEPAPADRLEPGTRLGSYEILEYVASGGMGHVYRARHAVLGREVAIKLVGARDDAVARRRLVREARHAAALRHPNICALHEIGEGAHGPFLVMEFVHGRTLSALLREGPLPAPAALRIGSQIADALAHAHRQGVLHRDLKSANVVIDDTGRAVVLDFGLSRPVPGHEGPESEVTVTAAGELAGTPSHMAPEVLQGGRSDVRSDVWGLGVLLFELLAGGLPFGGRTPIEACVAILGEAPRPMPRRVPLALRLVVERCLAKDPARRFQSAASVRDALETVRRRGGWPLVGPLLIAMRGRTLAAALGLAVASVGGAAVASRLPGAAGNPLAGRVSTLALLPLEGVGGDSATSSYAAGMTEAIVAQLGALAEVRIVSPASAARAFRGATSREEVAERLGVQAIVAGRVQKTADRLVVDLRLVEPARGRVVWSDRFDRGVREALVLQADVARALAREVRLTVRPAARERMATVRAVNAEAYEAYLRGRVEWNARTRESLQRAVGHFRRSLELDPTYAPASAALADCYNQFGTLMFGTGSPKEYRPLARAAAIRALQIDPFSAEAHATLGYVLHYDWEWEEAEREFRRAIDLDPNYPLARIWYANLLMSRRRWDEATAQVEAARRLDPYSLIVNTNVAWVLSATGRHEAAIARLRYTLALDSTYWQARWRLVSGLMATRRTGEALAEARALVRQVDDSPPAVALLAQVEAQAGDTAWARGRLRALEARARREYVPPGALSALHSSLGSREGAFRYLRLAFEERANSVAYMRLDRGRAARDPVYRALVERARLP